MPSRSGVAFIGRGCVPPRRQQARKPPQSSEPNHPYRISGAIWQPGVTLDSDRFKVLFDGEPRADIIAAGEGWVLILPALELHPVEAGPNAPLGMAYVKNPFAEPIRLEGVVQLIPADDET